jgi:hypothetical protein
MGFTSPTNALVHTPGTPIGAGPSFVHAKEAFHAVDCSVSSRNRSDVEDSGNRY